MSELEALIQRRNTLNISIAKARKSGSTVVDRWVIVKEPGCEPEVKRPIGHDGEALEKLLRELLACRPVGTELTIAELTWDHSLWVQSGRGWLAEREHPKRRRSDALGGADPSDGARAAPGQRRDDGGGLEAAVSDAEPERGEVITREEFLTRFKARLRDILGEHYDFGYVDQIAPTYWDDVRRRADGPEECAEAEASEWGDE